MQDHEQQAQAASSISHRSAKSSSPSIRRISSHKMATLALILAVPAMLAGCSNEEEIYDEYCYDMDNDGTITFEECPEGSYYEDDSGGFYYISSTDKRYRAKPSSASTFKSSKSSSYKGFGSSGSKSIGG